MVHDSFFFCFVGTFGLWRKLVGLCLYHDSLTYLKIPYLFFNDWLDLGDSEMLKLVFWGGKKKQSLSGKRCDIH